MNASKLHSFTWSLRLAAVGAIGLASAGSAFGQSYVQAESPAPFVSIEAIPGVGTLRPVAWTDNDESTARVPIGFDFDFLGGTYSEVHASTNGFLHFGGPLREPYFEPAAIGTSAAPNNIIAPFWADLQNASAQFAVAGTAPDRVFVFQAQFRPYFGAANEVLRYQVRLYEGSQARFEVYYDGKAQTRTQATMGYEGTAGAPSVAFRPCAEQANCSAPDFNDLAGRRIQVELPERPELTAEFISLPRGALPGHTTLASIRLRNLGTITATSVVTRFYLSTDATLDPTDSLIGERTDDVPTGESGTQIDAEVTVPMSQGVGDFMVLAEVDADGTWTELNEADNTVLAPTAFATAVDPVLSRVAPRSNAPIAIGAPLELTLGLAHAAVVAPTEVQASVHLSRDTRLDGADTRIGDITLSYPGDASEASMTTELSVPELPPGSYFVILSVDPNLAVDELDEANNDFASAIPVRIGPDFVASSVQGPRYAAPGRPMTVAFEVASAGAAVAEPTTVEIWMSHQSPFSPDTAHRLATLDRAIPSGGLRERVEVVLPAELPIFDYDLYLRVDAPGAVREIDETNNVVASREPTFNGPNFSVTSVAFSPDVGTVGTEMTVTAHIQTAGARFAGNVPVVVALSPDSQFDASDYRVHASSVFIPAAETTWSGTFSLPAVDPGRFFVVVAVNPSREVVEADYDDNASASKGTFLAEGADLRITRFEPATDGFLGLPLKVGLSIQNSGVRTAEGFRYAYYLSEDDDIRIFDEQVFLSEPLSLESGEVANIEDLVDLPTITSTSTYYFGVIVDILSATPETSELNNFRGTPSPIVFRVPISDLASTHLVAPAEMAAGETTTLIRRNRNLGVAPAYDVSVGYFLSPTPVVDPAQAVALHIGKVSLDIDEEAEEAETIRVPDNIEAGSYYLGLVVDPANEFDEIDETNNVFVSPTPITVYAASLGVVTRRLPEGQLGVPYSAALVATDGPRPARWRAEGLPAGLTLGADGILEGIPEEAGAFEPVFIAEADGVRAERALMLQIRGPATEVSVLTTQLPTVIAGEPYEAQLLAVGGAPPYHWSTSVALPEGLHLSEDGLLSGTTVDKGHREYAFRVVDSQARPESAARNFVLNVAARTSLLRVETELDLPRALLGTQYCDTDEQRGEPPLFRFTARNGVSPRRWNAEADLPAGLYLSDDGELCGTPEVAGAFRFHVAVQDATGLVDRAAFILEIEGDGALVISTASLPIAQLNQPYEAALTAVRGKQPYAFSLLQAAGHLPPGLTLDANSGQITGTPSEAGVFAFAVEVQDDAQASFVQPLFVRVTGGASGDGGGGCSCAAHPSQGTTQPWALAFLALALVGLRVLRRGRSAVATGLMALLLSTQASAQLPDNYLFFLESHEFEALKRPTVLWGPGASGSADTGLPFAFPFMEEVHTQVSISSHGVMAFGANQSFRSYNQSLTNLSSNFVVAPFWDDIGPSAGGHVAYQVLGSAPTRVFVIEWRNMTHRYNGGATGQLSFQVRIHEGVEGRLEVVYGPTTGSSITSLSGTMGIRGANNRAVGLLSSSACNTSCGWIDIQSLAGSRISMFFDPGIDVAMRHISTTPSGFVGAPAELRYELSNNHELATGPIRVSFFLAKARNQEDLTLITSVRAELDGYGQVSASANSTWPNVAPGSYWVVANADSGDRLEEASESNNWIYSDRPVRINAGRPDLAVVSVSVDAEFNEIAFSVRNDGTEPSEATDIATMISTNALISPEDIELARMPLPPLEPGAERTDVMAFSPPSDLRPGNYFVGVFIDPDRATPELSEVNNGLAGADQIVVDSAELVMLTERLPTARQGEAYSAKLQASGGDGTYTWSVEGDLPEGIGMTPRGLFFGTPRSVERRSFTVAVTSAEATISRELTIDVRDATEPLAILTDRLPPAVLGQEYSVALLAVGGAADAEAATWQATSLPAGFSLAEDGTLQGIASEVGTHEFEVEATRGDETDRRTLTLTVADRLQFYIQTEALDSANVGASYEAALVASGARVDPITWFVVDGQLPTGLALHPQTGLISGTPRSAGVFRFEVAARDAGEGDALQEARALLEILVQPEGDISISDAAAPAAVLNQPYEHILFAQGGTPPYQWALVSGQLPPGMRTARTDGQGFRFFDAPTEIGDYPLLVEVADAEGRTAQRAMVIVVAATDLSGGDGDSGDGCHCQMPANSFAGYRAYGLMAGLLCLGAWRRRRRRA